MNKKQYNRWLIRPLFFKFTIRLIDENIMMEVITSVASDITDVCFIISRYITQKNNLGPFLWHFIKRLSTVFDLIMSRSFSEQANYSLLKNSNHFVNKHWL